MATITKTQVWKRATWLEPSNVSFIAIPIALILITCKIQRQESYVIRPPQEPPIFKIAQKVQV